MGKPTAPMIEAHAPSDYQPISPRDIAFDKRDEERVNQLARMECGQWTEAQRQYLRLSRLACS